MPQQPLDMAIRRLGLILRLHMTGLVRFCPHQSPLIVLNAHNSLIGNVYGRRRGTLETQITVPRHILNRKESPIGDDYHIIVAICHKDPVRRFHYLGENVLDGIKGLVSFVFGTSVPHEDAIGTLGPGWTARGMERSLDVAPIKVRGIAQLIHRSRAGLVNFVDVEAAVDLRDGVLGRIENVAVGVCGGCGLNTARREDEVLVNELLIPTGFVRVLKAGHGAIAEVEELRVPLFHEWIGNYLLLDPVPLTYARIIDESA
jgi:hypothetical protein